MSALPHDSRMALACALAVACSNALAQQHDHASMQMQDMPGMDMSDTQPAQPQDAQPATAHKAKHKAHTHGPHADHQPMTMPMEHHQHAASAGHGAPAAASAPAMPAMSGGMSMEMPMDMDMSAQAPMDHQAHAHPSGPPATLPAPTAQARAAAFPDLGDMKMSAHMDDNPTIAVLRGDRLEHVQGGTTAWDARLGVGGNFDKLWLRSEGEHTGGEQAQGDLQLQWTHATGPWWDRVVSLRSDFGPGPSRQWAGVGVMGLAPYKFELEAHLYAGQHGRLAARFEGDYDVLLTNRLILTPRLELNAYSKDDPANRIGKGLSQGEAGLRLRYEFTRQFAPYVGYSWTRHFSNTADLLRTRDEAALDHGWVAGLRFWF